MMKLKKLPFFYAAIVAVIFISFCQLVAEDQKPVATTTPTADSLAAQANSKVSAATASLDKISEDAKKAAEAKEQEAKNWGVAKLEKVRNMTTGYTDIFFEDKDVGLASKLPQNTIIQIATLRKDLPSSVTKTAATDSSKTPQNVVYGLTNSAYWSQLDRYAQNNLSKVLDELKKDATFLVNLKNPDQVVDKIDALAKQQASGDNKATLATAFEGSYQGSFDDFAQTLKNQARALFASYLSPAMEASPYKLFAARNVMGAWRLVADTQDRNDPATQFIVSHYRDSQLNDWLGLRPVAQDKLYLSAAPSNAVTASADKFATDNAPTTHWKLDGSSFANCGLINRAQKGFLSCRDLKDERKLDTFGLDPRSDEKLDFTTYDTEAPDKQWAPTHDKPEKVLPRDVFYNVQGPVNDEFLNVAGTIANFFYSYHDLEIRTYHVDKVSVNENIAMGKIKRDFNIRDEATKPYSIGHILFLAGKLREAIGIQQAKDSGSANAPSDIQISKSKAALQEVLKKVIAHADYEMSAYAKGKRNSKPICYGDKIKFFGGSTLKHLYGRNQAHPKLNFLDTQNQGFIVSATDFDKFSGAESLGLLVEDTSSSTSTTKKYKDPESWWVIKGPHAAGDPFNATVGMPVKNGDVIRLEHVTSGKNLHGTDIELYDGKADSGKETSENFLGCYGATLFGANGVGDSFDNWVITFKEADTKEFAAGVCFELKHQNTGFRLSDKDERIYYFENGDKLTNFITAVEKQGDDTWFSADCVKSAALPVENVAWTGFPFAAPASDRTPKEDLQIYIVKQGIGGGIAPNNTLEINVNIQDKQPMVTGFAKEEVPEFAPGLMINLSPLFNSGAAWITQSFGTEGRASAVFLVRAEDSGNAQVLLGNNMTLDYSYKFVLGANENTATQLFRRDFDTTGAPVDTLVASISKEENPLAALRSGAFAPYWVSVDNNTLILGVGQDLGENILLVWHDQNPRTQVSRLGFGCDRQPVDITNVQIGKPFNLSEPKAIYAQSKTENAIGTTQKNIKDFVNFAPVTNRDPNAKSTTPTTPTTTPSTPASPVVTSTSTDFPAGIKLRVPGQGAISFDVKDSEELSLILQTTLSASKEPVTRYILKIYGQADNQDFERRAWLYLDNMLLLHKLLQDNLRGNDDAKTALNKARNNVDATFNALPTESREHIKHAFKNLMRNFEKWAEIKDGCDKLNTSFKSFNIAAKNINSLKQAVSFDETKIDAGTDSTKALLKNLFTNKLQSDLGCGEAIDNRDPLNTPAPQSGAAAIFSLFSSIFNNAYFDLEGKPICELQKLDAASGKLATIGKVLKANLNAAEDFAAIPILNYRRYWVSFLNGSIFVGTGEFGKNLFFYHCDQKLFADPVDGTLKNDFDEVLIASNKSTSIRDFAIADALPIKQQDTSNAYQRDDGFFDFKGKLQVILPYKYRLSQEGPSVKFKDELTGKTYYPGKVPQAGASYYFMLVIHEDGFPELLWSREPENRTLLEIQKRAAIMRANSDTLYQASTYVQGMGAIGGLIGVTASLAYSSIGVGLGTEAGKEEANATLNYKSHDSYVYTDQAKLDRLVNSSTPPEATVNQTNFQADLKIGSNWIGDASKLVLLIPHFRKIISRVTHPLVVSNQSDKNLLFSHLSSIFNTHKTAYADPQAPLDNTFADLIKLLMAAYNNRYLIDLNNKAEVKIRNDWYAKANDLARQILQRDATHSLKLEPMYGEYIWLNDTFAEKGSGSITFEMAGQNDAMIAFASDPAQVRTTNKQIYEISLGAWNNTKATIHTSSLGKTVAEINNKDLLCKIVKSADPKENKYWISVSNGKIILGKGDLDPKSAIGAYDKDKKQYVPVVWKPATLVTTTAAVTLRDTDTTINKYSQIGSILTELATLAAAQEIDANGYAKALLKIKNNADVQNTTNPSFPKTLTAANKEFGTNLADHLTEVMDALSTEYQTWIVNNRTAIIGAIQGLAQKGIDLAAYKDVNTALGSPPIIANPSALSAKEQETMAGYVENLMALFKAALPDMLATYPPFAYKDGKAGEFTTPPFSWQDPYPIYDIKYVGISSWDAPIEFSNLTVGPRVEDVDLYKANIIAKIRVMRGETLQAILDSSK